MIKVLIVDDSADKTSRVVALVRDIVPTDVEISTAKSVRGALEIMRAANVDLLIVDLLLPMRDGEEPKKEGGAALVQEITRRGSAKMPAYVVGLTAHEDLSKDFQENFASQLWFLIQYAPDSDEWSDRLGRLLVQIVESRVGEKNELHDYDLAIVTALREIELEAVLALDANWSEHKSERDDAIYYAGKFSRGKKTVRVIAGSSYEMGMPAATIQAANMIENFRPRFIAMVGIAAGVKGNFGDVLIASHSWDYGAGKTKKEGARKTRFWPAPSQIPLDTLVHAKVAHFRSKTAICREIRRRWTGEPKSETELGTQFGPIASGASVVECRPLIEEIRSHSRKVIGIEMEIYGVFMAARACRSPRPRALAMKSICDFGDPEKNDDYQRYAAFTSAQYLYEFALDQL